MLSLLARGPSRLALRVGGALPSARASSPAARSRSRAATPRRAVDESMASTSGSATASRSSAPPPADWRVPAWEVRVLFDGDCPLCVREVDFLRAKDDGRGRLDLVDIADPAYDPSLNRGIDFETAMASIHGITREGRVIAGIEVFERAYAAVGLGWVYAFAKVPALLAVAERLYDFWAERRLAVTGRPTMAEVMAAREKRDAAGGKTACAAKSE